MGGFLIKEKENFAGVRRYVAPSNLQPLGDNGQSRCVSDRHDGARDVDMASVESIAESDSESCVSVNNKVRKERDEEETETVQVKRRRLSLVQKQKRILLEDFEDFESPKKRLKTDDCSSAGIAKKRLNEEEEGGQSERSKKRRMDCQELKQRSKKRRREEQEEEEDEEFLVGVKTDFSPEDAEIQQRFAQSLSL